MKIRIVSLLVFLVGCAPDTATLFSPAGTTSTSSGGTGGDASVGSGGSGSSGEGTGSSGSGGSSVSSGSGSVDCDGGCSLSNAVAVCVQGQCVIQSCVLGYDDCDGQADNGCEVQTATDVNHCGSCSNQCPNYNGTPSCSAGECSIECTVNYGDCDSGTPGCETFLSDESNCGSCGKVCGAGASCDSGSFPNPASCVCDDAPTSTDASTQACLTCLGDGCCAEINSCQNNSTCNGVLEEWIACEETSGFCLVQSSNAQWQALVACEGSCNCPF